MKRVEVVAAEIERKITDPRWLRDGMVPSVRRVSAELTCGVGTVRTALRMLVETGVVGQCARNGRYAVRREATSTFQPVGAKVYRWEQIAEGVRRDLYSGHVLRGVALSLKELAGRYGSNARTMRKALDMLLSEELIRKTSRGYVAETGSDRNASRVIVIGNNCSWSSSNAWDERLYRGIELGIRDLGWDRTDFTAPLGIDRLRLDSASPVAGVICQVRIQKHWTAMYQSVARACAQRNVPIFMVDTSDSDIPFSDVERYRLGFLCRLDNFGAGAAVGRHLVSHGHRGVAFFSHVPFDPRHVGASPGVPVRYRDYPWANLAKWAAHRFAGLRDTCASASGGAACCRGFLVAATTGDPSGDAAEARRGIATASKALLRAGVLAPEAVKQATDRMHALCNALPVGLGARDAFEETLEDPRLTAWVCVNDEIAAMAREFLSAKSSSRSRKITIVGFDNSSLAIRGHFTSYDFLPEKVGILAVRAIAFPHGLKRGEERWYAVHGALVVR